MEFFVFQNQILRKICEEYVLFYGRRGKSKILQFSLGYVILSNFLTFNTTQNIKSTLGREQNSTISHSINFYSLLVLWNANCKIHFNSKVLGEGQMAYSRVSHHILLIQFLTWNKQITNKVHVNFSWGWWRGEDTFQFIKTMTHICMLNFWFSKSKFWKINQGNSWTFSRQWITENTGGGQVNFGG